ncbi:MAG: hypothetical protein AAFU85_29110 [Planctomycetota bacterium]
MQKRKLQLGIRDLLMLTVLIAVFALGYRVGHEEHLKSLQKGFANFDELMQLIEETTVPETWESLGGPESMEPYPRNLSLVITSDIVVHEQENERGLAP